MPTHTLPIDYKPKFMEEHVRTIDRYPRAFALGFLAYIDDNHDCPYERDTPEADAFIVGVQCARRNIIDQSLPVSPLW